MSVEESTYGQMLETSHLEGSEEFWIEEILEEAADIYGEIEGLNTGLEKTESLSEGYTGYVLENRDLQDKILGFEVAPVLSENYGTGFTIRPEERSEEYENFTEAIYKAIYREVESF
ncbi:hypothetical protein GKQ38_03315 [Candidatus Nanohaloarchaea archaeon]|nr:hypothetical protein GKQ38_03315 [Candidatus Nanohaloarchaea archaeon]